MPIDLSLAVGAELPDVEFSWTATDVLLYHLGLGAGADPMDARELTYVLEDRLRVLPTFGVVAPNMRTFTPPALRFPGIEVDLAKVLYGTQAITVLGPIPTEGTAVAKPRIVDVWDKGSAAVIVQEATITSADGTDLWRSRAGLFVRGEGGFGGARGPSQRVDVPDREPDHVVEQRVLPQQALLYRLCGDRNPLHADPEFAARAGFPRPILHGLCTYGMTCKAVADAVFDGDPSRVTAISARFAGVLFPGETLRTRIWRDGERMVVAGSCVEREDAAVLADAVVTGG